MSEVNSVSRDSFESLDISRKVRPKSKDKTRSILAPLATGLEAAFPGLAVVLKKHQKVEILTKIEFAKRKLGNMTLNSYDPSFLAKEFNTYIANKKLPMNDFLPSLRLDEPDFEVDTRGFINIGFMFNDAFQIKFAQEREDAIDILAGSINLPTLDPFAKDWKNSEPESLWLPVLELHGADEDIAEQVCDRLERDMGTVTVDLYNVKAREVTVYSRELV